MPTYDYHCPNCHKNFQVWQSITANQPDCPHCSGASQRIILSAPAIHDHMARGRETAARTFEKQETRNRHGPGCSCCH